MNLFELKPHPYSKIFPPETTGGNFAELVASVKKIGRVRNAVIVYKNQILDGNRRVRACKIAKVQPKWFEFKGTDQQALDLVWDLNYNRRDLTPSTRSLAFAEYCRFADEGRPEKPVHVNTFPEGEGAETTLDAAAAKVHVSRSTMRRAKVVATRGTNEQKARVRKGKATVAKVAAEIRAKSEDDSLDVDTAGVTVPEPARPFWDRREEAIAVLSGLRSAKKRINALHPEDPMWCEVNLNGVLSDLSNAISRFKAAVPAHVCPYCQGLKPEGCTACKGRGVISQHMWNVAVPEELKAMAEK